MNSNKGKSEIVAKIAKYGLKVGLNIISKKII
jgi:hypothetical protein